VHHRILVLTDDRPGNLAQALGVAEALGEPFSTLDVRYNRWGRLHNVLRSSSRRGLTRPCRKRLAPPWPRLVIGAGRRTAPLSRWFKRKFGCRLVHVMDPGWPGRDDFDLIAAPLHDDLPDQPNVIHTLGSCHRASPEMLAREAARWAPQFQNLPRPWLLLSVGGTTKDRFFDAAMAEELMDGATSLARNMGATILATTSRRTEAEVEAVLKARLTPPHHLHCWRAGAENPYLGMLGLADAVVVTGDSMNMCSEACANGGPVYIYAPPGMVNAKHTRLHELLYEQGFARPLGDCVSPADMSPLRHAPLNAALRVAEAIRQRGLLPPLADS
jgi:mitochondrial fission protein ELM1